MAIVTLFKHRKATINIIGDSLFKYQFTQHRFFTQIAEQETELKRMVANRASGIYIDPDEPTIDTEAADPVSRMKKNLRQEILDELRMSGKLLEPSQSPAPNPQAGIQSTADSVLYGNQAAEIRELQRQLDEAHVKADAAVAASTNTEPEKPELTAFEKLALMKQGNTSQE